MIRNFFRRLRITLIRLIALWKYKRSHIFSDQTILIVAPHPDDEVIGCGGLIQQQLEAGKNVHVVILSNGEASHRNCCSLPAETLIINRRYLTEKAALILGLPIGQIQYMDYPDGNIAWGQIATEKLKKLLEELKPDAVYVPHHGEGWSDHLATGNIVKRLLNEHPETKIYSYCVWFWYYNYWKIDWKNVHLLTMTKREHRKKLDAIQAYTYPTAPCGTPWSGNLPKVFIRANEWKRELFFKEK